MTKVVWYLSNNWHAKTINVSIYFSVYNTFSTLSGQIMTTAPPNPDVAPSDRTRLKRYNWLAKYDKDTINAIIDSGIVCNVGYIIADQPYVTPTNHWRIDDHVYWHGSSASRMLRAQSAGIPVCFSVTHLDGIVFARAAFNHNVNFRSVMAFGNAEFVENEAEKHHALEAFTNRLAPGLWEHCRKPSEQEWKATRVLRLRLDEVSAKVRTGPPVDEPDDYALDIWAGTIPIERRVMTPETDPKAGAGVEIPHFIRNFRY
ncbi:pyridoxamine 5'-phosphate oxidase family protein [Caballeronia mineralivorans]|jgi:nitroimidazol reductase NimA-like FMN-containing flavoprotein (pyridoxamine 5'-phosphate oxidase superfamily)|uniref:pyridoxamine 5'-phosphate oxidase family protein n=1 Tax=Caballeronia mineralivorans TaxID=2010198 RepID=UPI0023F2534E|nr:pyridoxamine 5'-phosphate oxidase family protein [Caballeronia mineralivorans]